MTVIVAAPPASRWRASSAVEVDRDELVAVQREDVAALAPLLRPEADAAAPPQPLRLLGRDHLGAEARELALEQLALPGGAGHDHALDARLARAVPTW